MAEPEVALVLDRDELDARPAEHLGLRVDTWLARLRSSNDVPDEAITALRELLLRAAHHQVGRMPLAVDLGAARREEAIQTAANEATVSVLARLDSFEGRSRFSTWAYKFGILHAAVEVRRLAWRSREIPLEDAREPVEPRSTSPQEQAEANDLAQAVRVAMREVLTAHQRRIATALLIDEVPVDVLADRLGTNRNALYKTLHDARQRLRLHLVKEGYLVNAPTKEVNP